MANFVIVQPPGHTVIVEHETITTLVLGDEPSVTIVEVPGLQGPPGPPGDAFTAVFAQSSPTTVWLLEHNLGRFPAISLVDTANDQIIGDVSYLDANVARVTFAAPTSGKAYLN